MAIIATQETIALIQGITGKAAARAVKRMLEYGTKIVAGTSPGKGGINIHGIPVYDSVKEAVKRYPGINATVLFVPARFLLDAALEAIEAEIRFVIMLAEGAPVHDMMIIKENAMERGIAVIGPNSPGVISPGIAELGITAHEVFHGPGKIGVVACTGSGQWYMSRLISLRGWGQSTYVGIGGDPVKGANFLDVLKMFERDSQTEAVLMISEIGGTAEMKVAEALMTGELTKPIVAYIGGRTAPPGRRLGHAGAIIEAGKGDVRSKVEALRKVGVTVIAYPWEVVGAFESLGIEPVPELIKTPIRL